MPDGLERMADAAFVSAATLLVLFVYL